MTIEHRLPGILNDGNIVEWYGTWQQVADDDDVLLTLPDGETFWEPCGVAIVAAQIARRAEEGQRTALAGDSSSRLFAYLQRMNFFQNLGITIPEQFMRHEPRGRFVPVARVHDLHTARRHAAKTRQFLAAQASSIKQSFITKFQMVFEELGANIVFHSGRPRTGFAMAQGYQSRNGFQMAFCDSGIGFLQSLARNYENIGRVDDHRDAIKLALQLGMTGSDDPHKHAGLGLAELQHLAQLVTGDLWIWSGDALWRRQRSGSETVSAVPFYSGACICLDGRQS